VSRAKPIRIVRQSLNRVRLAATPSDAALALSCPPPDRPLDNQKSATHHVLMYDSARIEAYSPPMRG